MSHDPNSTTKTDNKYTSKTYLSSEIFQNCSTVNSGGCSNTAMARGSVFQMSVDTTNWELKFQRNLTVTALTDVY